MADTHFRARIVFPAGDNMTQIRNVHPVSHSLRAALGDLIEGMDESWLVDHMARLGCHIEIRIEKPDDSDAKAADVALSKRHEAKSEV